MFKFMILLLAISTCSARSRTVVFANNRYYGHLLTGAVPETGTPPAADATVANPPVDINHKWTLDWDAIFTTGSTIAWNGAPGSLMDPEMTGGILQMAVPTAGVTPPDPNQFWKLTPHQVGNTSTYLYQIWTTGASKFCVIDEFMDHTDPTIRGFKPFVRDDTICMTKINQTYWNIYSA